MIDRISLVYTKTKTKFSRAIELGIVGYEN